MNVLNEYSFFLVTKIKARSVKLHISGMLLLRFLRKNADEPKAFGGGTYSVIASELV